MLKLVASLIAAAAVAQPPAWIARAVPSPIVAWVETDVFGNHLPEGIAISSAGGAYFVGVADSRLDPPKMVLDFDLARARPGSSVRWLDVRLSRTGGEQAWILRVDRRRLRLLRAFAADRIRLTGDTVDLYWTGKHETWRFERGAYRLVAGG